MSDHDNDAKMVAVLRRCVGKTSRPPGVSAAEVRIVTDAGYLRFEEWPTGHFRITEHGYRFIANVEDPR